ncbi:beta-galactosidase [Blautia wexlerae]|jgi:beta-galactosidase|uniref:beta-galactosidase n=1 Tax=Blautia wexlerae TaxID=418240 RepID=UPI000E4E4032|nr:beta-galactosidase [Blautia wexlerae]RHO14073.1 beta-galactosidase [Ruminococcus sp. AM18-44]RHO21631.1 beta-galactosidase [Ruminococcus sp. AM18-15]RHS05261.1 beta-galactosidase [Ruminococcus sp. AF14-5]RHS76097.1 beta-galactosidase [Ruminococcus sp. AM44-9AT]RHT08847.1 beta-galactosidase [Ruminococcus sp. AM40-10AC]RHT68639.1 beta-galactosidase [Ruminococcus sp. AM29-12LB]
MKKLLYGAAYYDEYMPYDRLQQDVAMMKKAGINTVRIAESTWSTCEPQEGVFDFSHVERVMDAMEEAGINVIIGTPTYAIPTWMVKSHPDVMAETVKGRGIYGARQIMDITHPVYRFYAERVIRKLMECTAHRKCVIGFQVDNETKYYGTAGKNVQEKFVKYLRKKFNNDLDAMNHEFGLDYWSNRINAWEDFPDVRGTINGSLGAEFEKFQRTLVDEFLSWQADIVNEYRREDQFITHNFDFEWRGYSYGVQPDVNHYHAAKALTIAGTDIYHPTQDDLTGAEIAFGGDMTRSLKRDNYLVLETEAQGYPGWTPYKGQLRLQAYSHLANGANSVMYWHWHSIHNSFETYWRGLLSHDMQENAPYREACIIGNEFSRLGSHLVNLKKKNEVAILVSNEALTALKWFGIEATAAGDHGIGYNDVVRWLYDTLFKMNVECDFVWPESDNLDQYKAIFVPALYAAPDELLEKLKQYTANGGTLVATFKTAFANENVKVSHEMQPHILSNCFGISYQQFTFPKNTGLSGSIINGTAKDSDEKAEAKVFMELLMPQEAEVLASYDHYNWKEYAAITKNHYGKGTAIYIGCMTDDNTLKAVLTEALNSAEVEIPEYSWPVIVRKGINDLNKCVRYILNYSAEEQNVIYHGANGTELFSEESVQDGDTVTVLPWNLKIVEEA